MRANEKRKLIIKRITEAILAFSLLVLICIPITVYAADSTELKPARPTISTKVTSAMNGVKFTIAKTTGAEGYRIYMKAPGTTKYKSIKTLKKDGTDKRSYTKKNLANGEYWFKVRAYRVVDGKKIFSSYSKAVKIVIDKPDDNSDDNSGKNNDFVIPMENDYLDAIEKNGYVGGGIDIGRRGKFKESTKKITWSSSDESVAKVSPYPSESICGSGVNEAYIEFIGPGVAIISATDGEYTGMCKVTVKALDDGYIKYAGGTAKTDSDFTSEAGDGYFKTAEAAASVLGAPGLEMSEGSNYNHPNGMAYYYDAASSKAYYILSDVYNNRVLIYKGNSLSDILAKDWKRYEKNIIVLGQPNINSNKSGYAMNEMNWPMDVAIDKNGMLYVADTRNNRILVYDNITSVKTGCAADHAITWFRPDHGTHLNYIRWPWAVSTDYEGKLIVTDTAGANLLIWNNLPEKWEESEENYYPDLVLNFGHSTTPRTISWTGEQLFIGDENARDYGACTRVFNGWPTVSKLDKLVGSNVSKSTVKDGSKVIQTTYTVTNGGNFLESFIYSPDRMNRGYGSAIKVDNRLYFFFANNIHIYEDGKIDSASERPDLILGTINARYSEETGFFFCGGGTNRMISAEGKLLMCLHQIGEIVGYSSKPEKFNDKPDIRFGGDPGFEIDEIVSHSDILVGGDVSVNEDYLVSSNELSKRLYLYDGIPTESGVKAQAMFDFNYLVPGPTSIHKDPKTGKTVLMTVTRTHGIFYIWHDYEEALKGNLPDTVFGNRVGSLWITGGVTDLSYDGKYTYITLQRGNSTEIYIFDGVIEKEKSPFAVIKNGGYLTPGDKYLAVIPDYRDDGSMSEGSYIRFYKMSDIDAAKKASGLTEIKAYKDFTEVDFGKEYLFRDMGMRKIYKIDNAYEFSDIRAMDVAMGEDLFAFSDLSGSRVLVWKSVDDALAGKVPEAILGNGTGSYSFRDLLGKEGGDVIDPIAASTKDTIAMLKAIGYDGKNLWVSEFKFANRILRFAK